MTTHRSLAAGVLVAVAIFTAHVPSASAAPTADEKARAANAVFYAGLGDAGFDVGRRWGATTMGTQAKTPIWTSSKECNISNAEPKGLSKAPNRLVGFSLGRLGPAYYLQSHEQRRASTAHIRTIALIDPGSTTALSKKDRDPKTGCDYRTGAGATLREWLKHTPGSRLLIIAGPDTQQDYEGLKVAYLNRMREVRQWVRVCRTTKLPVTRKGHLEAANAFGWLLGTWDKTFTGASCPEHTKQDLDFREEIWGKNYAAIAGQGGTDNRKAPTTGGGPVNGGGPATPAASVTLGQGPAAPSGFRYAISLNGFPANSSVSISCFDSVSPGGFYDFSLTTDGAGNASTASYCYSGDGPDHWVVAGGVESNHVAWGGSSAPPPAKTWNEQQGSRGANTFTNPYNASGMGPRIEPMAWVAVSCKVHAPQIASANPDGYWYRIASAPWNNAYYAVANTFWNGDVPGQKPYTHNTDFAVPDC